MPRVTANGISIAYQELGSGPNIVFVHGLATNRAFWFMSVGRAFARDHRVVMFDLRGHGASSMPPQGYAPADMVEDLTGLMDALDIERAHVVGHSFGGAVAMLHAARHPERVNRLVIADTRLHSLQPKQRLGDSPHLTSFESAVVDALGDEAHTEDHIGLRFLEEAVSPKFLAARRIGGGEFVPFAGLNGSPRGVQRWQKLLQTTSARRDFRAPLDVPLAAIKQIQQPTLLVYGEFSRCLPTYQVLAETLPACSLAIIPGAGHFHPMSRPRLFNRSVRQFLAQPDFSAQHGPRRTSTRRRRPVTLDIASLDDDQHRDAAGAAKRRLDGR